MGSLALGFLVWYYAHTAVNRSNARSAAQSASKGKPQGEMTLPPLGRVDPPPPRIESLLGAAPEEPPPPDIPEAWLRPAEDPAPPQPFARTTPAGSPTKTPEELALERQLSGRAFSAAEGIGGTREASAAMTSVNTSASTASAMGARQGARDLDPLLAPSVVAAVQARVLPTLRLLMPKGAFLDCTLETAIDSTLPGMTTCVLATDTFGADGSVVLLERGTKFIGETRGQVRQGAARIFVLWTEARTPTGVVVPLASPGTDELGRSGLPGEVDRHFWDRFGAAILVSVIDGGIQTAVQSQREDGGTVIVSPSASRDVMTEVLKSTMDIPPSVTKANGDRIQVLVARDLDFRSVYELHPAIPGR
jgi:type IV secretion system protein VirB10